MRVARALIVAAKKALDECDDVEYALENFEKAVSWYPKNRRLLEEWVVTDLFKLEGI